MTSKTSKTAHKEAFSNLSKATKGIFFNARQPFLKASCLSLKLFKSMKTRLLFSALIAALLLLAACDDSEDILPKSFLNIQLNPDDIYFYNGATPSMVRLDPLLNDSIKVDVTVSYSTPQHGSIAFIENEGWFYTANAEFFGEDNITYTVCHKDECSTGAIVMHAEVPLDPENCTYQLLGESVSTQKDQPVEIRIFLNDTICVYMGSSIASPQKGTFNAYSYSGNIKNTVYVYYPPKGFVGTDQFKYRIFTDNGDMEATCTITITE